MLNTGTNLQIPILHGRWTAENRTAIEQLLTRSYPEPPIAVFDWDNTCIYRDIGDATFHSLAADLGFKFDAPGFWDWVTEAAPIDFASAAYEAYRRRPNPDTHHCLRLAFERGRKAYYDGMDDNSACAWDAGAFLGWRFSDAREYARQVMLRELAHPLTAEVYEYEGTRIEILQGIRVRPEMQELVRVMQQVGWQVWVISASPQWVVEPFAELYGIPANRVVALRRALVDGRMTRAVEPPVSFSDGKLDAYRMFVDAHRPPWFAAGDSVYDWKLLEWAEGGRLLVEPTHPRLRTYAQWQKSLGAPWLVQEFCAPHI
ncbi:MAG: haloacid dehalogenase-like hydrolase [Anaerolineae bacterium]